MTTNKYILGIDTYGWERFNGKLWQRNYYEHIIRNEKELNKIRQYIIDNPFKWDLDENNPVNMNVGADQCVCPDDKDDKENSNEYAQNRANTQVRPYEIQNQ